MQLVDRSGDELRSNPLIPTVAKILKCLHYPLELMDGRLVWRSINDCCYTLTLVLTRIQTDWNSQFANCPHKKLKMDKMVSVSFTFKQ